MLRPLALRWLVGLLTVALLVPSSGAAASRAGGGVEVLSLTQVQRGLRFMQGLPHRADLPPAARDGVASLLDSVAGVRVSVGAPAPGLGSTLTRPAWSARRLISVINGYAVVVDTNRQMTTAAVSVLLASGTSPVLNLTATALPTPEGDWTMSVSSNGGEQRTFRLAPGVVDCTITCFISAGIVAVLTGLLCFVAVPLGSPLLATIICAAAAFTISYASDTACERIVQSCDPDPSRNIFLVNIADFSCAEYLTSCRTRGFVNSYQYRGFITDFTTYLEYYYNQTDFSFHIYDGAEMNLRQTMDNLVHKVWQWDAFLTPDVPLPYCATLARLRVWAGFGASGSGYSEAWAPKVPSESC